MARSANSSGGICASNCTTKQRINYLRQPNETKPIFEPLAFSPSAKAACSSNTFLGVSIVVVCLGSNCSTLMLALMIPDND